MTTVHYFPNGRGRLSPKRSTKGARCGFTLVEIMVVVVIISLLAMMSIPSFQRIQRRSRSSAIASDFRTFATVFNTYAQEHGTWPADTDPGVVPEGLEGQLNSTAWARISPMGGRYNWEQDQLHAGVRYKAAIAISATSDAPMRVDADQLRDIDVVIDDGILTTGSFRTGANGDPIFIIER
jgi:prepilin-type N-terminal cleavage/methylation domain-containing protein